MPGGDRTGPEGLGPMTGRAAGFCSKNDVPGNMNPDVGRRGGGFGRGSGFGAGQQGGRGMAYGRGRGAGRGRGWRSQAMVPSTSEAADPPSDNANFQALTDSVNQLQTELTVIHKRIDELERA